MKYKGIIFDLDDTLWDFHTNSQIALQVIWNKISTIGKLNNISYTSFLDKYTVINKRLWKEYRDGLRPSDFINKDRFAYTAKEFGVMLNDVQQLDIANTFLRELYKGQVLMPYTLEILEYLKPKYKIGLITNGFANGLSRLKNCGIEHFFDTVVCSEIYGKPKPDKGIFLHAVTNLKGIPQDCIYIGDNYEGDVVGAKSAGLGAIYFNLHDFDFSNYSVKPDFTITSLKDLYTIL